MKPKDFGVDDGAIRVEEYETHIEVRPLRKLEVREISRINSVINRHVRLGFWSLRTQGSLSS